MVAIVASLMYYIATEMSLLNELNDYEKMAVHIGILLFCTAAGVKIGGIKDLVKTAMDAVNDFTADPATVIKKLTTPLILMCNRVGLEYEKLNLLQGTSPLTKTETPKKEEIKK